MTTQIKRPFHMLRKTRAFRIVLIYMIISFIWILTSDTLVNIYFRGTELLYLLSISKGWFFIIVTAILLFYLINKAAISDTSAIAKQKELRQEISNVLENISDAFVSLDNNWRYTYMNKKAGELFNRNPEEMIGKHIWTEFPEGVGQPFYHNYYKAVKEQIFIEVEEYYPPYDKWFENRIYPSPDGLSIFFYDITERKKSEEQLRKWEHIFKFSGWSVVTVNPKDNTLLAVNPACEKTYGYSTDEMIGMKLIDLFAPEAKSELLKNIEIVNENMIHHYESTHIKKDGTIFPVLITVSVCKDEEGNVRFRAANIIDITERL